MCIFQFSYEVAFFDLHSRPVLFDIVNEIKRKPNSSLINCLILIPVLFSTMLVMVFLNFNKIALFAFFRSYIYRKFYISKLYS